MTRWTLLVALGGILLVGCSAYEHESEKGSLPIEDDFESGCQWPEDESDEFLLDCVDSAYRLQSKRDLPQYSRLGFENVAALRLEAEASGTAAPPADAAFGIGCWDYDGANGYVFAVRGDGAWTVVRHSPRAADERAIQEQGPGSVELSEETNALQADCLLTESDAIVAVFLNGRKVAVVNDDVPFDWFGRVGLAAAPGTDARFDNVAARELSEEEAQALAAEEETTAQAPAPPTSEPVRTVYKEDFSRKDSLWPDDGRAGYAAGGFRMRVRPSSGLVIPRHVPAFLTHIHVEVDARQTKRHTKQEHGMSCLLSSDAGYSFAIQPDSRLWRISTYSTTSIAELASGPDNPSIRPGPAKNRLRGICSIGSDGEVTLTFFVNGQQVGEAVDPTGIEGFDSLSLNLDPGPSGGEVVFDDIVVRGR